MQPEIILHSASGCKRPTAEPTQLRTRQCNLLAMIALEKRLTQGAIISSSFNITQAVEKAHSKANHTFR